MTQARVNLAVFRIVQPTSRDCKNRQWLQLICRITTVLPFSHDRQRRQVNAVIAVYHQTRKNQYVWLFMRLLSLPQPQSVTMLRRGKSFLAKTPAIAVMGPQPISLRTYQMIPKTGHGETVKRDWLVWSETGKSLNCFSCCLSGLNHPLRQFLNLVIPN